MSMTPNSHRPTRQSRHRQMLEWFRSETGSVGPVPVWERRGQDMGSVELAQVSDAPEMVSEQREQDMGSVELGQVLVAREPASEQREQA